MVMVVWELWVPDSMTSDALYHEQLSRECFLEAEENQGVKYQHYRSGNKMNSIP